MVFSLDVIGLLEQWKSEAYPTDWHLMGVLADALQENNYDEKECDSLRHGRANLPSILELHDYGWQEAFGFAGEPFCSNDTNVTVIGEVSDLPFARWEVVQVVALDEGQNDGESWLCVGELRDGRWFALKAWCDYTGWD